MARDEGEGASKAVLRLRAGPLDLGVDCRGGTILSFRHHGSDVLQPVRHPAGLGGRPVASFPLVPFGNRLEGNNFHLNGALHRMAANTDIDPLYLHGDGWLGDWDITEQSATHAGLAFRFAGSGSSYAYHVVQTVELSADTLSIDLAVRNEAAIPLPYGLGHHLFLPLTVATRLVAPARSCWSERAGHLPDRPVARPDWLDFDDWGTVPDQWVNSGFEGWTGRGGIDWPERSLSLTIEADALFDRYFLFVPGTSRDPGTPAYFCFEPMSHTANGHHLDDLGGLRLLAPGEQLAGSLRLMVGHSSHHHERHASS